MTRFAIAVLAAAAMVGPARAADPINLPYKLVEAAFLTADCTAELKDEPRTDVEDLVGLLKLVEIPCWQAAYQSGSIFFAVNPAAVEKARLLRFPVWTPKGLSTTYSLTAPDFNPKTKRLASFHKGRGIGDCGSLGEWKWVNGDFRLTGYWYKENCDGQPFNDDKKWRVYPPAR